MNDQAETLRRLMLHRDSSSDSREAPAMSSHVITVASGKGGVGKSCIVANLGAILARSGLRVLLVDGDFGLANLEILFGVHGEARIEHVMAGKATLKEAVLGLEPNLWLLPASTGLMDAKLWEPSDRGKLITLLESCPWEMDVILLDVGSGIQENVLSLHSSSYHSLVVVTPEPTSITDSYGLIKLLRKRMGIRHVNVVVNKVTNGREGQVTFQKIKDVASKFVDIQLEYLGHLQRDEKITQSVMKRKILLDLDKAAVSISCLELLAKRIRSTCLGWVGEDGLERSHASRFKDEPALLAPRNSAKFWRTLLGEVKV
jgi:flagellar biosynthesis protein FlhG